VEDAGNAQSKRKSREVSSAKRTETLEADGWHTTEGRKLDGGADGSTSSSKGGRQRTPTRQRLDRMIGLDAGCATTLYPAEGEARGRRRRRLGEPGSWWLLVVMVVAEAAAAVGEEEEEEDATDDADKDMDGAWRGSAAAEVKEEEEEEAALWPVLLLRWKKALGADSKWCRRCRRGGSGEVSPPPPSSAPSGGAGGDEAEIDEADGEAYVPRKVPRRRNGTRDVRSEAFA
jgi:hypothetical protein